MVQNRILKTFYHDFSLLDIISRDLQRPTRLEDSSGAAVEVKVLCVLFLWGGSKTKTKK